MSLEGISVAGEVILSKANLISGSGSVHDITGLIVEIDITEDIFTPVMTGHIILVESFGLIHDLPIIGEEFLEVEMYTPTLEKISKRFKIYKIAKEANDRNIKNVLQLDFISVEALVDLNIKISKAFTGTASQITSEITKQYFDKKTIDIEESSNVLKFVSPYWSPFKCINYSASKSFKKDSFKTPDFLFFESNKNFHFRSLSSLYKQKPFSEYFYDKHSLRQNSPDGLSTRDINREFKTISSLEVISSVDYMKSVLHGIYSFNVFSIDVTNKTIIKNNYSYTSDFKKTEHLGKSIPNSKNLLVNEENARIETKITNSYVHDNIKRDFSGEVLSKRVPLLGQAETICLEMLVPGRTDISVGKVITLNLKTISTKKTVEDIKKDNYRSGNYLISKITHRFTQTRHIMTCRLIKDSYESDIVYEAEI